MRKSASPREEGRTILLEKTAFLWYSLDERFSTGTPFCVENLSRGRRAGVPKGRGPGDISPRESAGRQGRRECPPPERAAER